jgi:hypothetical protein
VIRSDDATREEKHYKWSGCANGWHHVFLCSSPVVFEGLIIPSPRTAFVTQANPAAYAIVG